MKEFKDLEILEDSKLELVVSVNQCYPFPQISWHKDDQEIKSNENFQFFNDNSLDFKLIISSVKELDQGKYAFKIWNDLGVAETSCLVKTLGIFFI